jgi:amidase
MDRSQFLKSCLLAPVAAAGFGGTARTGTQTDGVRRLARDRNFVAWRPDVEPAYRVKPGEVVLVDMSHGLPGLVTRDGVFRKAGPEAIVNPQTGPVFVDGIARGDALAVDILDIKVGDWGYCSERVFELRTGYAVFSSTLRLPLEPMLGCLGIAPANGTVDTRAPADTGGNMDCRDVRAGSTVVFTARVDGALVGMGDAHALQGDGEITGQGIETDAEALVRFRKLPEPLSDRPVILRPESFSTVGSHKNLEEAAWQATDDMVSLLRRRTGRTEKDARLLVGLTGRLKINQIVDPTKGARMEVPSWVFGV